MILLTLKFNHLAALAVMSVCQVCKNNNHEEVSHCSRCNWSIKNDIGIDQDHEILAICIPTVLRNLESETANNKKLQSIIQRIELQKEDNHKLDKILDELETDRKQTHKHFERLSKTITELESLLLEVENKSSNIPTKVQEKILAIQSISSSTAEENLPELNQTSKKNGGIEDSNSELLGQADFRQSNSISLPSCVQGNNHRKDFVAQSDHNENNSSHITSNEQENSLHSSVEERNSNNNYELINEPEASLCNETGDHKSSIAVNYQESNEPRAISGNSYQRFYRMTKSGELEFIRVAIPQETIEKARSGTQSELNFAEDRKGNYWIVKWDDVHGLIPKEKNIINQHQYGNFQRAFNCQDYYEDYSTLEVIEPAIITNYNGKNWRLEKKGKIKFI